jgi:hypothetical protein
VGEGGEKLTILKRDDTDRLLEASDGNQVGSIKIIPEGKRKSKIIVTADLPKEVEKESYKTQELAAFIMKALCEGAQAECESVKK